ncbi:NGRN protein, partial [Acromyrmex insinuator]
MMTEINAMTMVLRRMFSKKATFKSATRIKPFAGIQKKMKFIEKDESVDHFDPEDISEFEADFMNVGISRKMYEREMQSKKERLKQQIVIQKYFKEKEPRFLTFAEKELIHKLHNFNPEEWTIEKLSESFPALPETIRKILRSKWSPKSVEKVVEYDNVVKQNWEKFRKGEFPLNPILSEHLMKFKDREIISTDRELLAKQFVSTLEFKKPKSQLFSNIVQTYLDEKQENMKLLSQEHNSNKLTDKSNHCENQNLLTASTTTDNIAVIKNTETYRLNKELSSTSRIDSQNHDVPFNKKREKLFTFDEFVNAKLEDINKESPEEGITLLNAYRKQVDASQEVQSTEVATASDNAVIYPKKDAPLKIVRQSEKDVSIDFKDKNRNFNIIEADNLLNTSIIARNKKVDVELNYAKPIKIAKHLYKPGMTYRISDCYYDDDGEFLYRVPSVHN